MELHLLLSSEDYPDYLQISGRSVTFAELAAHDLGMLFAS
jgi:hypothetical protein